MQSKSFRQFFAAIAVMLIPVSCSYAIQDQSIIRLESSQETDLDIQSLIEEIDEYAIKVNSDWNVPGMAIGVVKDGEIIFARGYGVRELGRDAAVNGDTLFACASNSKAFTTTAMAMLVGEGKLDWEDPVTKYLPDFQMPDAFVTREMTVRDLVSHRVGMDTFSGDLLWYDTTYTADEIIERIRHLPPVSSFRSTWGYQNLMYITAGKVIEKVTGRTWAEVMQERILTPLNMSRTTTSVDDMQDNYAMPHNESWRDQLRVLPPGNVDNCWGACGINSSVNDMCLWMNMHLANGTAGDMRLVSEEQIWDMQQPNVVIKLSPGAVENNPTRHFLTYGLGFFLYDYHGHKVVSHGGGLDGMISQLAMVPEKNLGVIVLTNSESSASRFVRDRVLECFLGATDRQDQSAIAVARQAEADQSAAEQREQTDASRVDGTRTSLELEGYAGTYSGDLYGDVTVSVEDGQLVMRLVPAPNFVADLEHWHYDTFQIKWRETVKYDFPRGWVTFTLDGSGQTDELKIDQPNNDFWFYELKLNRSDR
ncbi:MAG: serine hydrolase [Planctomycetota bacterium]